MSAAEIIAMIEKLPRTERAEVYALVEKKAQRAKPEGSYLPQAEAERIAERVFKENSELFRRLAQ